MNRFRRWVIVTHRYLGIPLSGLFVVWFVSGIAMMYSGGMPTLSPAEQRQRHAPLDLSAVRLGPREAVEAANHPPPERITLATLLGRPAYRFGATTVFADTGERLGAIELPEATGIAADFARVSRDAVRHEGTLAAPDQWTLGQRGHLPLYKFRIADDAGSEIYVSSQVPEVTMWTTRRDRAVAWVGAIPHWFYFTALRNRQELWTTTVVWTATLGTAVAVLGLVVGIIQFRWRRGHGASVAGGAVTARLPYTGLIRWHYLTGLAFGLFTLTWVFSGLLSMEPYAWTRARGLAIAGDVMTGGRLELNRFGDFDPGMWARAAAGRPIAAIELRRIHDDPYYLVHLTALPDEPGAPLRVGDRDDEPDPLLVDAVTMETRTEGFEIEVILDRLRAAIPTAIADTQLLTGYDGYYYGRGGDRPLPVLRVKFADPDETWLYIDPRRSEILGSVHRLSRLERWLFNGLHSLDFQFWYSRRPLWDLGLIVLSLGGIVSSGIGLWLGAGRIGRWLRRVVFGRASKDATL